MALRLISSEEVIGAVSRELVLINTRVPEDLSKALKELQDASSDAGRLIMDDIMKNAEIAASRGVPMCQDTGMVIFFANIGTEVSLAEPLPVILDRAVAETYVREGYRPSVVVDPINRINSGNNTPAIVHIEQMAGENMIIDIMVKGFGSENMSRLQMMKPADGYERVADFVVDTVARGGGNPCPPIIVGVGVGGTFEQAPLLAKRALLRPLGSRNTDEVWAEREAALLKAINMLNIGPGGLGGGPTALAVHIIAAPTHIAGLPVAVNISCHASRHGRVSW
jgi:fumarate hydratase subunit alpha